MDSAHSVVPVRLIAAPHNAVYVKVPIKYLHQIVAITVIRCILIPMPDVLAGDGNEQGQIQRNILKRTHCNTHVRTLLWGGLDDFVRPMDKAYDRVFSRCKRSCAI